MKLALYQMRCETDKDANLHKSLAAIHTASHHGADLILFPEIHLSQFFPQYPDSGAEQYAATVDGTVVQAFREASKVGHIMAVPNFYLSEDGSYFDASVLIDADGEIIGVQKMVHIAQAEQFYEQSYYAPSNDGFHVYDTAVGKIGMVICFDRHYPESIRTEALMGADLILIPTANVKAEPSEMFQWEIRVQSFQNSVPIAMCNRVGQEDGMDFSGASIITDADGNLLALAGSEETILYAEVDMNQAKRTRNRRPYTQLRRTEWYR